MPNTPPFVDDDHALKAGMVMGTLMRAGILVRPNTDENGNYQATMVLQLPPLEELAPPIEVWIKVLSGPGAS